MTVTNFKTLKADVIRRNLLSTGYFAEDVTLTDGAGLETAAVAKPGAETTEERASVEYGRELVTVREFFLELAGAAVPAYVTLAGVRYAVEGDTNSGEFTVLKTKRIGAVEQSRDTYRRRNT